MISSSIITDENASSYLGTSHTAIHVKANEINLVVSDTFKPYPGMVSFGVYSQSGVNFFSTLELEGDTFSYTSPVDNTYGIYMYSNGKLSLISLDFTDSIEISMNTKLSTYRGGSINVERYDAQEQSWANLKLNAGNFITLSNDLDRMIYNAGALVEISSPVINVSSGSEIAVYTDYTVSSKAGPFGGKYLEGGKTYLSGERVTVASTGPERSGTSPDRSGTAVVTNGYLEWGSPNGLTQIVGSEFVYISSESADAIDSRNTGTTSVSSPDGWVNLISESGRAIHSEIQGTTSINGNLITIESPTGTAIHTETNGTTIVSGTPTSKNQISIKSEQGEAIHTETEGTASVNGTQVLIQSMNKAAIHTETKGTTNVTEDPLESNEINIISENDSAIHTELNGTAEISGDQVTITSANGTTIHTESEGIITATGNNVYVRSKTGPAISTESSGSATITGDTVVITNGNISEVNQDTVPNTIPYVIGTMDQGSTTNINYGSSTDATVGQTTLIAGRVLSYNSGATNIGMNSASSLFVGSTDDGAYFQDEKENKRAFGNLMDETASASNSNTAGAISIYGGNGSTWIVKPNPVSIFDQVNGLMNQWSNLSKYQSNGFSVVDLTTTEAAQDLNIGTLTGNSASFRLRTYIDEQRITGGSGDETQTRDHVNLLYGNGQHFIVLSQGSTGIGVPYLEQFDYLVWSREPNTLYILNPKTGETEGTPGDDNLSFKLGVINEGGVDQIPYVEAISKIDMGIYNYFLTTRDRAHDGIDMEGIEFFLSRGEGRGPGGPDYSPSTDLDRTLAGFGGVYAIWWAELSDLRKRLGEVRYGAQDGAWAKVLAQKDDIAGVGSGRFTQKLYAVNLGIDHMAVQSEDRMWLLGGNFKYANANQRIKHSRYGKGDIHNWGMNLYATYANQYGCYSDLVLTYDHYKRKVNSRMLDNTPVGAKWNNYGLGISLEIGKMFSSTQDDEGWGPWYNHWWIEPQAQLAYYWVHGKGFTLSNGLQAKQGNTDFLTGRLGVVIGKKFNYGKDRAVVDKRYSQFYIKGGIKHEFLGNQRLTLNDTANEVTFKGTLRGTRVYYGGGFDWNFTDQLRLYAQIERENGGKYKKDYEVSVGLRWQF